MSVCPIVREHGPHTIVVNGEVCPGRAHALVDVRSTEDVSSVVRAGVEPSDQAPPANVLPPVPWGVPCVGPAPDEGDDDPGGVRFLAAIEADRVRVVSAAGDVVSEGVESSRPTAPSSDTFTSTVRELHADHVIAVLAREYIEATDGLLGGPEYTALRDACRPAPYVAVDGNVATRAGMP